MSDDYQKGWSAYAEFRSDTLLLNNSGAGWRMLGFVFALYGSMIGGMMLLLAFTDLYGPAIGWSGMRQPFSTYMLVGSAAACIASVFMFRRANKVHERAQVRFNAKWSNYGA